MASLFNWIWRNRRLRRPTRFARALSGEVPVFTQFGHDIYASDVVQQAIGCLVGELVKLTPTHIRQNEREEQPLNSTIQRLLNEPNDRMTQTDFLEKMYWQLFLNKNAFVIPTFRERTDPDGYTVRTYTGLWPIQPLEVDFIEDAGERLFVRFGFANGYETTLRYSDVIHVKHQFSFNEFMGGNDDGQRDDRALLKTLQMNESLLESLAQSLRASYAVNGIIKYNTLMDDGAMDANIQKIEQHLKNSESGFLPMDIKGEFIQLKNDIKMVDNNILKFIDEKILRNFGVPLPILTGDFTKQQYEAFYQKSLEYIVKRTGEAFTQKLFTRREKGWGHKVKLYPHDLVFMSNEQKLEMSRILGDRGSLYENEIRVMFGMRPIPELVGVRMMSLNYINVEDAKKYQTGDEELGGDENGAESEPAG